MCMCTCAHVCTCLCTCLCLHVRSCLGMRTRVCARLECLCAWLHISTHIHHMLTPAPQLLSTPTPPSPLHYNQACTLYGVRYGFLLYVPHFCSHDRLRLITLRYDFGGPGTLHLCLLQPLSVSAPSAWVLTCCKRLNRPSSFEGLAPNSSASPKGAPPLLGSTFQCFCSACCVCL